MRFSDVMKPAMEWSEAAMLPARVRTISDGAALRQVRQASGLDAVLVDRGKTPAPASDALLMRARLLRRAAYHQVRRFV